MSKHLQVLIDSNNTFVRRRRLLFIAFFLRRILGGIQYSIIIPSGWQYLKMFDVQPWLFGVTVALYHVSALISLPIAGMHYDRFQDLKALVTVFNVFEIIGNLVYALPFSVWCLLIGRLLAGVGGGFYGIISSEIASITTKEERLTMFARMELGHLLGLFIGPVLSTLFENLHIHLGKLVVDFRNAPGICCAILWLIMQGVTVLLIKNIAKEVTLGVYETPEESIALTDRNEGETADSALTTSMEDDDRDVRTTPPRGIDSLSDALLFICSFEVSYVYVSSFVMWAFVWASETTLPLFTQVDFGWTPVITGVVYLVIGIEAFILYCLVGGIGRYFKDSSLLIIGLGCSCVASLLWIVYGSQRTHYHAAVAIFCVACIIGIVCCVVFQVGAKSLLSKIASVESQGMIQSTIVMVTKFANIVGPIFGTYAFRYTVTSYSVVGGLMLILLIWGLFSKRKLDETQTRAH